MHVHVYAVCWNESRVVGFFLRHYEEFADRIVVYDEGSDDGTRDILQTHPKIELRQFIRTVPDSLELSKKAVHDHCWKEARGSADWVILVDIDEHVYHPNLDAHLVAQSKERVSGHRPAQCRVQAELERVLNSRSWRLTTPVRKATAVIRNGIRAVWHRC